jgi:hypothetical protein
MTTTIAALIEAKFAENAETVQYTSTNCKTAIDKLTATNITGSNATLTVHMVPAGGAAATSNAIVKTITPGQTWPFPEVVGHSLEAGDFISMIAGTASAIWIRSSGRKFT